MTKAIALISLAILLFLCTLGNYWFTFGLWPRSWGSFIFFASASALLTSLVSAVVKDK